MLNPSWALVFTPINLLVLYFLLRKFLFRPVMRIMEEREKLIQDQFAAAEHTQNEALTLKQQYEESVQQAQEEADAIVDKAKLRASEESEAMLKDAGERAEQMIRQAEKTIEAEREKTMQGMTKEIAGLAVAVAEKAIGGQETGSFDNAMMELLLKEEGAANE